MKTKVALVLFDKRGIVVAVRLLDRPKKAASRKPGRSAIRFARGKVGRELEANASYKVVELV